MGKKKTKKKNNSGFEFTAKFVGSLFAALFLWIFIGILFSLFDIKLIDVFQVVEGNNDSTTTLYNFLILYVITTIALAFGSSQMDF